MGLRGRSYGRNIAFASENMLFPFAVGNMSSQLERSIVGTGLGRNILLILNELTSALVHLTRITRKRECTHRRANWKSAKCACLDVANKYAPDASHCK
jgi:hypothetical protein